MVPTCQLGSWITAPKTKVRFVSAGESFLPCSDTLLTVYPEDLASTSTGSLSSLDNSDTGSSALSSASSSATVIDTKGTKPDILDLAPHRQHATGSAPHPVKTVQVAEQVTDSAPPRAETVSAAKGKCADRRVRFAEDDGGVVRPEVREIIGLGQHKLVSLAILLKSLRLR